MVIKDYFWCYGQGSLLEVFGGPYTVTEIEPRSPVCMASIYFNPCTLSDPTTINAVAVATAAVTITCITATVPMSNKESKRFIQCC